MRTASEVVRSLEARIARLEQSKVASGGLSSASGYDKFSKETMEIVEAIIISYMKKNKLGEPDSWEVRHATYGAEIIVYPRFGHFLIFPIIWGAEPGTIESMKIMPPSNR